MYFLRGMIGNQVRFTSIAIHDAPLPKGTLHEILEQTGIKEEELKKMM